MYHEGSARKFKLLQMLMCLWTGPLVLFSYYKKYGHLPKGMIIVVIIVSIFAFMPILLGNRSCRKYYMNKEISPDKNDE